MIYKLAVSVSAAVGLAALDIREDDVIVAIAISNSTTSSVEVSFASVPSILVNDANSSLMTLLSGIDMSISDLKIPVTAGERLYLHVAVGTGDAVAMIYTAGDRPRPAVRRR
jgi:hypothetical protein